MFTNTNKARAHITEIHIAQCQHMNVKLDYIEVQNGCGCGICCKKGKKKTNPIMLHIRLLSSRFEGYSYET